MAISSTTGITSAKEKALGEALREIPLFSDLSEEQLAWFVSHAQDLHYAPGEILIHEGEPANSLFVILDGEVRAQRESAGGDAPTYIVREGQVTGLLPFSRMTVYPLVGRAMPQTRVARVSKDDFPQMLAKIPQLVTRFVSLMADRIREVSRVDQQRDKLMALGKLSAGLAHELNNPASAASRAAEGLKECMIQFREASATLDHRELACPQRSFLAEFERETLSGLKAVQPLDSLTQSDLEEEVTGWLESHGVQDAWKLSSALVEGGLDCARLDKVAAVFDDRSIGEVLRRLTAAICAEKLIGDIESSTGRISTLVRAIKEYSYMDQAAEQEVDVHAGIESTLTMLNFKLKKGVAVIREFDRGLPHLFANGGELNQVWTNLIDNAADAMSGKGELRIRTSREFDRALIEIIDNGPGIPDEIKDRIFEPFFTTKGVGEGTGLGLDTVYRIVRNHHGEIRVDSRPGRTAFQVRLPIQKQREDTV